MRTTLTLDADVAAKLKAEVHRSGRSFKELVNDLLRSALSNRRQPSPAAPFRVRARPLGSRPGLDYDRISHLVDQIEGPVPPLILVDAARAPASGVGHDPCLSQDQHRPTGI